MATNIFAPQIDMQWKDGGQYMSNIHPSIDLPIIYPEPTIKRKQEAVAIIDFLNMARIEIADKQDAKFQTIDDFVMTIKIIALKIRSLGDFKMVYLVTKSFRFSDEISYQKLILIIIWAFCSAIPDWQDRICLVLVNGIDDKDREADDRALFFLYSEYSRTTNLDVFIFSNDNFSSLKSHFFRRMVLNFYTAKKIDNSWENSEILYHSDKKRICMQNIHNKKNDYLVVHPNNNHCSYITVSH